MDKIADSKDKKIADNQLDGQWPNAETSPKQAKKNVPFLILGGLTPIAVLAVYALTLYSSFIANPGLKSSVQTVLLYGQVPLLILFLILYLWGKAKENTKLLSYGLGAFITHVTLIILLPLLLFGACLISLTGYGK